MSDLAIRERGIIFSAPMVLALLEGRKTQTRRTKGLDAINTRPGDYRLRGVEDGLWYFANNLHSDGDTSAKCPYGQPGDRLWVRETWRYYASALNPEANFGVQYRADGAINYWPDWDKAMQAQCSPSSKWRPSIFMPRWASRITPEITDVRVERVQEINECDIVAEGIPFQIDRYVSYEELLDDFRDLWDSINGKTHPWASNPWVWAISFKPARAEKVGRG